MTLAGCVLAALAAAMAFAVAALLQQRAASAESAEKSLRPALLLSLVRRGLWLAGVGALVGGYGFQALALALGPVAVVQPLITTELVFAVPLAGTVMGGRPGWQEWLGVLFTTGGVSLFLGVASPAAGTSTATSATWAIVLLASALGVVLALVAASAGGRRRRPMALAAAAGLSFALLAVLTKSVVALIEGGLASTFLGWQTYAVVLVGILGLLFSQSAYQAGPLAFSMPVVAVVEPTVAVVLGSTVFGERIDLAGGALAAEAAGAAIALGGVVLLATSGMVLRLYGTRGRRASSKEVGTARR